MASTEASNVVDVPALAQEVPDRPGDLRRRERGGRDLIEKRLKQMMIAAVDEGDADRRAGEPMNGFEPAESGADDDHVMGAGGGPRRHRLRSLAAAETPQLQTSAAARRLFSLMSCDLAIQATSGAREPFRAWKRFIPPLCGSRIQSWQGGAAEVPAVTPSRKLTAKFLFRFTETRAIVFSLTGKSYAWTRGPVRRGWRHPGGPRAAGDGFKAPRRPKLTASA